MKLLPFVPALFPPEIRTNQSCWKILPNLRSSFQVIVFDMMSKILQDLFQANAAKIKNFHSWKNNPSWKIVYLSNDWGVKGDSRKCCNGNLLPEFWHNWIKRATKYLAWNSYIDSRTQFLANKVFVVNEETKKITYSQKQSKKEPLSPLHLRDKSDKRFN